MRFSKKLEAVYFSLMRGDFGGNVGFHLKAALVGSIAFLNCVPVKKNTMYFLREKIENEFCLSLNLEISFYIFQECQVMGTTTSYSFSEPYFSFSLAEKKIVKTRVP